MSSNGSSNGAKPDFVALGAPRWYIEGERYRESQHKALEHRVGLVEAAVLDGAPKLGARAGGRWGAFLGAALAAAISTGWTQCSGAPAPTPTEHSVEAK